MDVLFEKSFLKDLEKLDHHIIKQRVSEFIDESKQATSLSELHDIKKIKGHDTAYRKRMGDYRIGFFLENDTIIFSKCLHRKDIYRKFPK